MSRKLLICQHVPYELLGTLNPLLKKEGFRIKYVNFGRHPHLKPSMDDYDGLIVLGGPMNCDEIEKYPNLSTEIGLITRAIETKKPVLGICLGAQLIARALKASVAPHTEKEIGWYSLALTQAGQKDPLLSHLSQVPAVFQWHGDTFEIPEGAVHLATSPSCKNQAFKYLETTYALQFHLEVDEAMIRRWLTIDSNLEELEFLRDKIRPERILEETPFYIHQLNATAQQVFQAWTALFKPRKRFFKLGW